MSTLTESEPPDVGLSGSAMLGASAREQPRWSLVNPATMIWSEWEGEGVIAVFHGETGETHLIGELPAEILGALRNTHLTAADIVRRWSNDNLDAAMHDEHVAAVLGVLTSLEDIELVQRCSVTER